MCQFGLAWCWDFKLLREEAAFVYRHTKTSRLRITMIRFKTSTNTSCILLACGFCFWLAVSGKLLKAGQSQGAELKAREIFGVSEITLLGSLLQGDPFIWDLNLVSLILVSSHVYIYNIYIYICIYIYVYIYIFLYGAPQPVFRAEGLGFRVSSLAFRVYRV